MKKTLISLVMAVVAIVAVGMAMLTGCSSNDQKEILVVSFGTSYDDTREATIGAVEDSIRKEFPEWDVVRAFTSEVVISRIEEAGGDHIMTVEEAIEDAASNGVGTLVIQPTHLLEGVDYDYLVSLAEQHSDEFKTLTVSDVLLSADEDYQSVASVLQDQSAAALEEGTAVVYIAQGSSHETAVALEKLQGAISTEGIYICSISGDYSYDVVIDALKGTSYKKLSLRPLMVTAGEHATNDIAGKEDYDKSAAGVFGAAGYETEVVMEGLGQVDAIDAIYVSHCSKTIEQLQG